MSEHDHPKELVELATPAGEALLPTPRTRAFQALKHSFVHQYEAHCGAASAVVVMNALVGDRLFTQDNLFGPQSREIVERPTVWQDGLTLEQCAALITSVGGFPVRAQRAGDEGGSIEDFRRDLAATRASTDEFTIVNFSHASLAGEGMGRGHFTPVWEYHAASDRLLILEVYPYRNHVWIKTDDLFAAMRATDAVTGQSRGWLVVSRP